jgi:acrylyl-CoA reductase (NADPH)
LTPREQLFHYANGNYRQSIIDGDDLVTTFDALLISKTESGPKAEWTQLSEEDLMEGDVTVRVTHTTINYKDGLAVTGKAPIVRRFPLIPGIDLAGEVTQSSHASFKPGDKVLLNGYGVGETHHGGYAGYARLKGDWLLPVPAAFTPEDTMALGTAGYTAMLCVMALEANGVTPERGTVLVTGAAGGVGSVAISLLSRLGYTVAATTGRPETADYLTSLGATEVLARGDFTAPARPLGTERWAGAIDVVGSNTLANVLSQTAYGGAVAACGLAGGMDLTTSVAPFILRGVTLAGVDSVMAPMEKRKVAWERLARDLDKDKLRAMTEVHSLREVLDLAPQILEGKVRGRIVLTVA